MTLTDKRPLDDDEDMPSESKRTKTMAQFRMLIPALAAGSIIGKGGENIKKLRANCQSGAYLRVPESPNAPERVLLVTCSLDDIPYLLNEIAPAIFKGLPGGSPEEILLLVPADQAGLLLGKGGAMIGKIRDESGAKVKMFRDKLPLCDERVFEIRGGLQEIIAAVTMALEILVENPLDHQSVYYAPSVTQFVEEPGECGGYYNYSPTKYQQGLCGGLAAKTEQYVASADYTNYEMYNQAAMYSTPAMYQQHPPPPPPHSHTPHAAAAAAVAESYTTFPARPSADRYSAAGYAGEDEGSKTVKEITIPNDMTGKVIGHKGAKIEQIRRESGAKIDVANNDQVVNNMRNITITGTTRCVTNAHQLLLYAMESQSDYHAQGRDVERGEKKRDDRGDHLASNKLDQSDLLDKIKARFPWHECYDTSADVKTEDIYVDNGVVGCIIGPGGSRIKEIRKKSNCNIKVADNDSVTNSERQISISGNARDRHLATYMINGTAELFKTR